MFFLSWSFVECSRSVEVLDPAFRNALRILPKIWEASEISEALEKRMEGIKHLQASPTDLRALKLDHEAIHGFLLPRLPLVPCDPRVSCPVMHTKSTLETFVPKKKTGTCCDDCEDCDRILRLRPGAGLPSCRSVSE